MINKLKFLLLSLVALSLSSCINTSKNEYTENDFIEISKEYVMQLHNKEFSLLVEEMSDQMKDVLNEETLEQAYDSAIIGLGNYENLKLTTFSKVNDYSIVTVEDNFTNGTLYTKFTYGDNLKLEGLYFDKMIIEVNGEFNYFTEIEYQIGTDYPLNGLLTIPNEGDNFPVVLLVHGSGSSDKNETIFENTPFKDIAHSLADKGIATFRYDKRFYSYPELALELGNTINLENEVLEDVNYALDLLETIDIIDKENIFVLGHSLGGGLTPYIASQNSNINGIISMAGTLRPIYEVSYDQNKASEKSILEGDYSEEIVESVKKQMIQVERDIITLREDLESIDDDIILLGLPAYYQKSLKKYAGENFIDKIDNPVLVLQGTSDFQVSLDKDFLSFKDALFGRENVNFFILNNLNHLMMESNGSMSIDEYKIKSHVSMEVINNIEEFINKNLR